MPEWLTSLPFALALAALFLIAMARGQGTYWLARLVTQGASTTSDHSPRWRVRTAAWLNSTEIQRGRRLLGRWGLPLISLGYLTIGFQTVVLASAGVLRIGWVRFTLAQLPGAVAWALIYGTIGFVAWEAAVVAAMNSPVGLAVVIALVGALVTAIVVRRRSRRARETDRSMGLADPTAPGVSGDARSGPIPSDQSPG